jgi:O-antigen ligase
MRRSLGVVGALVLVTGPTVLAFFSGGYFDRARIVAALVAWVLAVVAAFASPRPLPVSAAGRAALAGLVLLCAWTALSLLWAPLGDRAQDDFQRLLLYLGYFIAALALLRDEEARRWLEPLLALGAFVVIAYGLSERLLPELVELSRSRSSAGRLEQPLSYWNAEGAVAAIGFVLAVRVSGDPGRSGTLRRAAAFAGVVLGLGTYLSFSRGALAAAGAGLLLLLALAPDGRAQLRSAVTLSAAAGLAALAATQLDTIQSLGRGETGDAGDGLTMLAVLLVLALGASVLAPRRARRPLPAPSLGVSRPLAVLVATVVVAVAGFAAVAVLEGKPEGTSPVPGADPERLGSIDTNRYRYWDVALEAWAAQPLRGIGSGGFQVRWLRERDRVDASGDAHSLYIETAAELGLVGLLFLGLFVGAVAAGLVRLSRTERAAAAGLAAGLAAWAVHAGLDWDWEMPAVSLLALALAAAALAWAEEEEPVGPRLAARTTRSGRNE